MCSDEGPLLREAPRCDSLDIRLWFQKIFNGSQTAINSTDHDDNTDKREILLLHFENHVLMLVFLVGEQIFYPSGGVHCMHDPIFKIQI